MRFTKYEIRPVPWPWQHRLDDDKTFLQLCRECSEREVQFAKALVVQAGDATAALASVHPAMPLASAKTVAHRLGRRPRVAAVVAYLRQLVPPPDHVPVDMHEVVNRLESAFRRCENQGMLLRLADMLIELRGLSPKDLRPEAESPNLERALRLAGLTSDATSTSKKISHARIGSEGTY